MIQFDSKRAMLDEIATLREENAKLRGELEAAKDEIDYMEVYGTDGFHTFQELYEHRHALFINLLHSNPSISWRANVHEDGTMYDGWFIAGMNLPTGMISYHLPVDMWEMLDGSLIATTNKAPKWDGHSPDDVVKRLNAWKPTTDQTDALIAAAKEVRDILDTDTPDNDNRLLEVRIAQAVIDCVWNQTDALIAAAYMAAGDVCMSMAAQATIRALTPADAKAKLRELCLEVARKVADSYGDKNYGAELEAIVDEVLGVTK